MQVLLSFSIIKYHALYNLFSLFLPVYATASSVLEPPAEPRTLHRKPKLCVREGGGGGEGVKTANFLARNTSAFLTVILALTDE